MLVPWALDRGCFGVLSNWRRQRLGDLRRAVAIPSVSSRVRTVLIDHMGVPGSAFVAVGHRSGSSGRSAWTIAVVDQNGRVVTRKEVSWSWPEGSDDIAYVEFKEDPRLAAKFVRVDRDSGPSAFEFDVRPGACRRCRRQSSVGAGESRSDGERVVPKRRVRSNATNHIIAVGRRTLGIDDGTCATWSQSYVQGLTRREAIWLSRKSWEAPTRKDPTTDRASTTLSPIRVVGNSSSSALRPCPKGDGARCKDQIMAGTLSPAIGQPRPMPLGD